MLEGMYGFLSGYEYSLGRLNEKKKKVEHFCLV